MNVCCLSVACLLPCCGWVSAQRFVPATVGIVATGSFEVRRATLTKDSPQTLLLEACAYEES